MLQLVITQLCCQTLFCAEGCIACCNALRGKEPTYVRLPNTCTHLTGVSLHIVPHMLLATITPAKVYHL